MQIASLRIQNFRGIREGLIRFQKHTVFVGPNNCGKSTIIEALALLFGRERMVRSLTEHDFHLSDPQPADRIRLTATVIGFDGDDPSQYMEWFRADHGITKWWDPVSGAVVPQRGSSEHKLACEVAFAARFHRPSLEVESVRYFHDDDAMGDVFADEAFTPFPSRLIRELGFFLVPASRTWDRTISFGSELFRRVVAAGAGQPYQSVLDERDKLRKPAAPLEGDQHLEPIVTELNKELRGFFYNPPSLHLRVTATDSDSLLEGVVTHYAHQNGDLPIPARRHGSGLLSLQHLLLLLQFGRMRSHSGEGFCMALEEPELHVPPALQRRLAHRIQALSAQTFITTHSPLVAALADPQGVIVLRNEDGILTATSLQNSALPASTPNSVRKLFQLNRLETVAALMHEFVLVPEGRTDYEWIRLLARAVALHQSWATDDECRFDSLIGVVPTHDGAVVATVGALQPLHPRVLAMVDGDAAGHSYASALVAAGSPNSGTVLCWPDGWTLEDVLGWIVEADPDECLPAIGLVPFASTSGELVARLKSEVRGENGHKKDTAVYEAVADAIGRVPSCCCRASKLLNAMTDIASGQANPLFDTPMAASPLKVFKP